MSIAVKEYNEFEKQTTNNSLYSIESIRLVRKSAVLNRNGTKKALTS
jgi:hypothetical protein